MLTRWLAALSLAFILPVRAVEPPKIAGSTSGPRKVQTMEIKATFFDVRPDYFGTGRKPEYLAFEDALGMALNNNLEVKFDRVGVAIEEARKSFAFGVFDPVFTASATRESTQQPDNTAKINSAQGLTQLAQIQAIQENTRAVQIATNQPVTPFSTATPGGDTVIFDQDVDRYQASLQVRTPWGMRLALTASQTKLRSTFFGDTRTIIPQYSAFGGIEVRQPLLQGFGPAANLNEIRIARVNKKVAEMRWEKTISDTVQAVMAVYYDMIYGLQDIRVKEEAIAADKLLVEQNQRRMELGFMSPIDVQQARVAVSLDEEALLGAKFFFMERQFQLKRLILKDFQADDPRIFVPRDIPQLAVPVLDRNWCMRTAFENRLDYRSAVAEAEVRDIQLKFVRNQMLPQLDLIGTYGFNGLDDSYSSARQQALSSQAPQWTAGVQFSLPLGNIQGRAQVRAVKGFKEQALLKIKQTELTVSVDVDTVLSRIETNRQRVATARETRQLNDEAVRIANRRLDEGQISSFDVIETRRKLYDARSRELAAIAELNKSVTLFWNVTGTVLERTGVVIK